MTLFLHNAVACRALLASTLAFSWLLANPILPKGLSAESGVAFARGRDDTGGGKDDHGRNRHHDSKADRSDDHAKSKGRHHSSMDDDFDDDIGDDHGGDRTGDSNDDSTTGHHHRSGVHL
jgi:hypothetical protein